MANQVKVVKIGNGSADIEIREGDTVGSVLERVGYSVDGCQIQKQGIGTALHEKVYAGQIVTIAPKVGGGR